MNTALIQPTSPQSVIKNLCSKDKLPFIEMLSDNIVSKYFSNIVHRKRTFTPVVTLCGFLSQAIGADQSCQAAVSQIIVHSISKGLKPPSANTAAYCKARGKLPEHALSGLTKDIGTQLEDEAKSKWLWRGKHVKLIDGSTLSMPDTPENQEQYPQPKTQKKGLDFLSCVSLESFHWQQEHC